MEAASYLAKALGAKMEASAGGYSGAGYSDRYVHWQPGTGSADRDTVRDLRELRARSRDLVRNTPIGSAAIETPVSYIVGKGLRLQSRVDAKRLGMSPEQAAAWQSDVEWRFAHWAESTHCDANDELTFAELQDLAVRSELESGDVGVLLADRQRAGWPFRLALQLIEADRISNPKLKGDSETLVQGFERKPSGEAVAVHICSHHPGAMIVNSGQTWARVPLRGASGRRNFLFLKKMGRPGQSRGVPSLAPVIGALKQMDRFSEAEIDAAVNSAAQAVFATMDHKAFQELFEDADKKTLVDRAMSWDGGFKPGQAVNLLPGESIESPTPGRPNPQFEPFFTAFLSLVGVGLNIPNEVLAKRFQGSYSAARAALMDAWRNFSIRRARFASKFCQPVYEEWLSDEVAAGRVAAPGYFADPMVRSAWCAASWAGDGPGAIDPGREADAIGKRIELGLTTLADETSAYDGGDWEVRHAQRTVERAARLEADLEPPMVAPIQRTPNG